MGDVLYRFESHRPTDKIHFYFGGTTWKIIWKAESDTRVSYVSTLKISRSKCFNSVKFQMKIENHVLPGFLNQGQFSARADVLALRLYRVVGTITLKVKTTFAFIKNSQNIDLYGSHAMGEISFIPDATKQTNNQQCTSKTVNANVLSASFRVSDDLLSLLNNPDSFPDATVRCGTFEIHVHKCILAARSPVFAAMFRNHPTTESLSGMIEIVDMVPHIVQLLLVYIYSGRTNNLHKESARDLLPAANLYELEELKTICVDQIIANMDVSNVIDCLILGELQDKRLKKHAKEFICKLKKFSDIGLEKWKSVQVEHKDLAIEVLMSVVEYLQKK